MQEAKGFEVWGWKEGHTKEGLGSTSGEGAAQRAGVGEPPSYHFREVPECGPWAAGRKSSP